MLHRIIVKYNETVTDREAFAKAAEELFKGVLTIEGIHGVRTVKGLPIADNRWDLIIEIDMDRQSLEAYSQSEPHKIWKRDWACYIDKKAIFDSEER